MIEDGLVVRRVGFKTKSIIGRPEITIKYLQNWNVDEIFFINVGKKMDISDILNLASKKCFLPITVGGSISNMEEVSNYMKNGADKVVIGKYASASLLTEISNLYGDQAICLSIDKEFDTLPDWPCGELLLHDTKRDGVGQGLNMQIDTSKINKPIIGMGGVGSYEHIAEGLNLYDAVAVGNLFHFKEIAAKEAKALSSKNGHLIR